MSVGKLWLSMSLSLTYRMSDWDLLLLAMLLFPLSSWNWSVSVVTVKLFSTVWAVSFWLPTWLVELNLKKDSPRGWLMVRFTEKLRFLVVPVSL